MTTKQIPMFSGTLRVVFNDFISDAQADKVFIYVRDTFENLHVDAVTVTRHGVSILLENHPIDSETTIDSITSDLMALKIGVNSVDTSDLVVE